MHGYNRLGLPVDSHGVPLNMGEDPSAQDLRAEMTTPGAQELYGQHNNTVHYGEGATPQVSQFQTPMPTGSDQVSALGLNAYNLYASPRPVPEELLREPSGTSIAAPSSVLDEENGRTYCVHETGRYFLPNDAVCLFMATHALPHDGTFALIPSGGIYSGRAGPPGPAAQNLHDLSERRALSGTTTLTQECSGHRHWHGDLGYPIRQRTS